MEKHNETDHDDVCILRGRNWVRSTARRSAQSSSAAWFDHWESKIDRLLAGEDPDLRGMPFDVVDSIIEAGERGEAGPSSRAVLGGNSATGHRPVET
jgi:hypothetical protein